MSYKHIIIEDERSAIEYIETVLSEWDAWKSHHVTLVQALEILVQAHKSNNANTCISCGAIIPEGRQVCPKCEEN